MVLNCQLLKVLWSLLVEIHLGPDGTRLKQNVQARLKSLYKQAGQFIDQWKCKGRKKKN